MDKFYSRTHEWVQLDDDFAIVGVSEYGIQELGNDVTYVRLPKVGKDVIVQDCAAILENDVSSSEVFSPVSGTVVENNGSLLDDPNLAARSPEEFGWLYKLDNVDSSELDDLMTEEEYRNYLETL